MNEENILVALKMDMKIILDIAKGDSTGGAGSLPDKRGIGGKEASFITDGKIPKNVIVCLHGFV